LQWFTTDLQKEINRCHAFCNTVAIRKPKQRLATIIAKLALHPKLTTANLTPPLLQKSSMGASSQFEDFGNATSDFMQN
jgi:hypothetical protein